jgi:hypothetical protein
MRAALANLGKDPSGKELGLDVKRLDMDRGLAVYRLKVGAWRAAFLVGRDHVRVVRVFHRSEGYAFLAEMGRLSSAVGEDITWGKKRG